MKEHPKKASEKQKIEMIRYFEMNPEALRIVSGMNGDVKVKTQIWQDVGSILNNMGNGAKKPYSKWAKTWADMKVYAKTRAKSVINGNETSGANKAPTEVDLRILTLIGQDQLLEEWQASIQVDGGQYELVVKKDNLSEFEVQNQLESEDYTAYTEEILQSEDEDGDEQQQQQQQQHHNPKEITVELVNYNSFGSKNPKIEKYEVIGDQSEDDGFIYEESSSVQHMIEELGETTTKRIAEVAGTLLNGSSAKKARTSGPEKNTPSTSSTNYRIIHDPMATSINNLASALNNVAEALGDLSKVVAAKLGGGELK